MSSQLEVLERNNLNTKFKVCWYVAPSVGTAETTLAKQLVSPQSPHSWHETLYIPRLVDELRNEKQS